MIIDKKSTKPHDRRLPMDPLKAITFENVLLSRRGHYLKGSLILSDFHMVFSFAQEKDTKPREIWLCYPVIGRMCKARGSSWSVSPVASMRGAKLPLIDPPTDTDFDRYSASHIRVYCKDFTYYSFDFVNDSTCSEVYHKLSLLITSPKFKGSIKEFYAYDYKPNMLESRLESSGWLLYSAEDEYRRQDLISEDPETQPWRLTSINETYRFCPSYPRTWVVPSSISDSILKHAGKFRSKQRLPAVVYKHRVGENGNVIARCSQPLVGLNLQNRSIQDEKLVEEIFRSQQLERAARLSNDSEFSEQPQRNLIVDLRPLTNALAQHALGAGTENVDNYKGRQSHGTNSQDSESGNVRHFQNVDKIFCNIDNIHVMRDSVNKLISILSDLDRYPVSSNGDTMYPLLQQSLTKTQWLHRLSVILQSVDRITKSVHLNNTNVLIHCSDGWDRTSQVSALLQLCLDPYFRTMKGFMVLIEKEWISFGFKFATRADHGGCIGALIPRSQADSQDSPNDSESISSGKQNSPSESTDLPPNKAYSNGGTKEAVTSFLQRAATHIKNTASAAASSASQKSLDSSGEQSNYMVYKGSNECSPVFHQFLECVYQIMRQHPTKFEFNSRFLKRLFYHYYSCQYGTFLFDNEMLLSLHQAHKETVSLWDYFLSRPTEFTNASYHKPSNDDVLFINFSDVKWWFELYGRTDEEMNGLSNSLDKKFAQLGLNHSSSEVSTQESTT